MIGCLRTRVCKQPIIALYFESGKTTTTDHRQYQQEGETLENSERRRTHIKQTKIQ